MSIFIMLRLIILIMQFLASFDWYLIISLSNWLIDWMIYWLIEVNLVCSRKFVSEQSEGRAEAVLQDLFQCNYGRNSTGLRLIKYLFSSGTFRKLGLSGAVSGFLPGGGRDIFRGWWNNLRATSFPSVFFAFLLNITIIYAHFLTF